MTSQIFKLKNYEVKRNDPKIIVKGSYKEILTSLNENKGYHLILYDAINYNLFFDIDKVPLNGNQSIYTFFESLSEELNVDLTDIKYTESKKDSGLSYHVVIPSLNANLKTQLHLAKQLKTNFDYIDLDVYQNNRFFRLPNQTLKDKPLPHLIVNGIMSDFILDLIQQKSEHLEIEETKKTKPKATKKYEVVSVKKSYATDEQLNEMLSLLPADYLDDYHKWIIITNILKGQDKKEIWDKWSKQSDSYSYYKNQSIWRSCKKIIFDVNYLQKITNFKLFKSYIPIIEQRKMKQMDNKFLYDKNYTGEQLTYKDFKANKTIIIQSCTGTGKTTAVAEHLSKYIINTQYKLLSIISRITLGDQHVKSFSDKGLLLFSYNNGMKKDKHFVICINSLLIMNTLTNEELSNYIVFIDEINSFLEHITHNETLHHALKPIYALLIRIIKNAHKVIVADALISDNVFTFLQSRISDYLFIKNDYKKYKGIKAHRLQDENDFKQELERKINSNQYFFFGCDSCSIVEEYFYYFYDKAENKDDFVLFTANHKFNITDANEQFRNKFLFFSPAITTAVDFNISDKQNVFIYIKGHTIQPSGSFQQTTRTRNIKELYYYCSKEPADAKFNSLDEVKDQYNKMIIQNDILTEMSLFVDEDDNIRMSNNSFFNMFCYNEYVKDIFNTNKLAHYENILKENEFILDSKGKKAKIDEELKSEMTDLRADIDENLFKEFLNAENKELDKYKIIMDRIKLLELPEDIEILTKYKNYLMNPHDLTNHLNVIRFFKSDHYINSKVLVANEKNFKVKQFYDVYNKIKIFRTLQDKFSLSLDNLNYNEIDNINIEDVEWKHIQKLFRYTKDKPTTKSELKPIIIQMIKSITNNLVDNKQVMIKKVKQQVYTFNKEILKNHLTLNEYSNPKRYNYSSKYDALLNIKAFQYQNNKIDNLDADIFDD